MGGLRGSQSKRKWSLIDTYGFISTFLARMPRPGLYKTQSTDIASQRLLHTSKQNIENIQCRQIGLGVCRTHGSHRINLSKMRYPVWRYEQRQYFHDYFVTHLPSSSLHPDSRSSAGPHHKLPRAAATPHTPGSGVSPAAAPPMGASRELTVVRIPLKSAKHHFGVSGSRGSRPYNEDSYQAGTIEIPAFAKRAPVSLSRNKIAAEAKQKEGEATSADSASGDPQVFYFGIFDGHGGNECSDFLRDDLHKYIEASAKDFELRSSLKKLGKKSEWVSGVPGEEVSGAKLPSKDRDSLPSLSMKSKEEVESKVKIPEKKNGVIQAPDPLPVPQGENPIPQMTNKPKALELEASLVEQWKDTVGGYFRRFRPEHFSLPPDKHSMSDVNTERKAISNGSPISIESVLMYAFLRADLDFITAQASKPDPDSSSSSDAPLNNDEILGSISQVSSFHPGRIGGPIRFKGGSTASVAMISTPTPTPFWHPASPSTLMVAHVGDTRILLCETSTGLAVPMTTNHHPSSPVEGTRLRRYAATFVTDSFGEERMSGLANTRAFGDMRSKRIGVSAEPELVRLSLGPAQYSFLVLVSDGVSGTLSDQEIVDVVKEAKTPDQGARDVVSFATEVSKDGDNATCLVVRLGGWERRGEGGMGSLGSKEVRDFRRQEATDPRSRRT